jgi:regulator of protease activity HflC (stomatin/prohibitin superfamily)
MSDFSSVIQLLAIGGFLVGFGGIALIVSAASQNRSVRGGVIVTAVGLVTGIFLLVVSQGLLIVEPTQRAVVFNVLSGDLEQPRSSGVNIIIPGVQNPVVYPISQQSYTMSNNPQEGDPNRSDAIEARSIDGQQVSLDITLIFRIADNAETLNELHRDWSNEPGGYLNGLVRPVVRSIARDVVAGFPAESIYGSGREEMQSEIEVRLRTRMAEDGLEVRDLLVREINFSEDFLNAIEAKQVEEQQLERAITQAQRLEEEARGRANAAREEARGEADARLLNARAEAEALRLVSEQIAANPNLIQYNYVQELADNIGLALVPSNSPFLFDFDSFTDLGSDFIAPQVPEAGDIESQLNQNNRDNDDN